MGTADFGFFTDVLRNIYSKKCNLWGGPKETSFFLPSLILSFSEHLPCAKYVSGLCQVWGMQLWAGCWEGFSSDGGLIKLTSHTIWTLKDPTVISNLQTTCVHNVYLCSIVSVHSKSNYYLKHLPDMSKILSYTDHNNWFATAVLMPQDWKAADILCAWNNGLDVWVREWGMNL